MDVFLYLWGGEGYLTCASVHAMAMMGMFDNIGNARLNFKCLDFAGDSADNTRWESMAIAFDRYHRALFGDKNESVVCGDTNEGGHFKSTISKVVSNPASEMTLSAKYNNNELLYIGCSRDDVKLDIKEGIYGKPWVGEAYHADSHFDALYPRSLDGAPITVINCGGYKGGGTAATFIPLEATHSVTGTTNVTRFNVVAGPSTQFNREVPLDHPDAYNTRVERVDRFEIEEKKAELENDVKPDAVSKQNHKANKSKLENAWKEVYSPPKDYRNLNPDFYMGRFIDKIRSDDSINSVDATFVNLKANLKPVGKSCNYDCTAAEYKPDKQEHILHITNLINAITVKELMKNGAAYKNHKIYTFQTPGNVFRTHDMFEPEDAKNLYYFLEFVIFLVKYVYPNFNEFERPGADVFWKKWAIKVGRNYAIGSGNGKSASVKVQFSNPPKPKKVTLDHTGTVTLNVGETLQLMHGFTSCKTGPMPWSGALTLDDVLAGCYAFLEAHPTETVLFAAKYEHGDASVPEVQQTLDAYIRKNPDRWLLTDTMPTLGQARGKLVLLRRWEDEAGLGARAGLPLLWEDQKGHADPYLNTRG